MSKSYEPEMSESYDHFVPPRPIPIVLTRSKEQIEADDDGEIVPHSPSLSYLEVMQRNQVI